MGKNIEKSLEREGMKMAMQAAMGKGPCGAKKTKEDLQNCLKSEVMKSGKKVIVETMKSAAIMGSGPCASTTGSKLDECVNKEATKALNQA